MAKKLSAKDKVEIIKTLSMPLIREKIIEGNKHLQQAQDDFINLYGDGDRNKVIRNPIFSVVDAQVQVEMLGELMADVERMLNE